MKTKGDSKATKTPADVAGQVTYTVPEVARALNLSEWSVRELISSGELRRLELPSVGGHGRRRGARMRRILVTAADLADFIERCRAAVRG